MKEKLEELRKLFKDKSITLNAFEDGMQEMLKIIEDENTELLDVYIEKIGGRK